MGQLNRVFLTSHTCKGNKYSSMYHVGTATKFVHFAKLSNESIYIKECCDILLMYDLLAHNAIQHIPGVAHIDEEQQQISVVLDHFSDSTLNKIQVVVDDIKVVMRDEKFVYLGFYNYNNSFYFGTTTTENTLAILNQKKHLKPWCINKQINTCVQVRMLSQ